MIESLEENMKRNLGKVKELTSLFKTLIFSVDELSKLAASLPSKFLKDAYFEVLKKLSLEMPQLV